MDFLLGLALVSAAGYVGYQVGKIVGYEEAVSRGRAYARG
jgi:hypothetical protein